MPMLDAAIDPASLVTNHRTLVHSQADPRPGPDRRDHAGGPPLGTVRRGLAFRLSDRYRAYSFVRGAGAGAAVRLRYGGGGAGRRIGVDVVCAQLCLGRHANALVSDLAHRPVCLSCRRHGGGFFRAAVHLDRHPGRRRGFARAVFVSATDPADRQGRFVIRRTFRTHDRGRLADRRGHPHVAGTGAEIQRPVRRVSRHGHRPRRFFAPRQRQHLYHPSAAQHGVWFLWLHRLLPDRHALPAGNRNYRRILAGVRLFTGGAPLRAFVHAPKPSPRSGDSLTRQRITTILRAALGLVPSRRYRNPPWTGRRSAPTEGLFLRLQRESRAAGRRRRTVRTRAGLGDTNGLKQLAKLLDGEAGVANDTAQGKCVDGVVTRDGKDARAVGHDDVLAFADHRKSGLFESAAGIEVIDARNLWQG